MTSDEIIKKYPNLYPENFYFECLGGWNDMLDKLSGELDVLVSRLDIQLEVRQVKEKFGTLRYYVALDGDETHISIVRHLITYYESKSATICEECGSTSGKNRDVNGWYMCRCEECFEKMNKKDKK